MTRKMKDSGVEWIGEIPEDWEVRKLGNISKLYTGNSISDNEKDNYISPTNAIPYIATKDVGFDNKIDYDNGMYIRKDDGRFKRAYKGSTLVCIEGGSAGRKIAKIEEREVCFVNKLCCINSNIINNEYIYYYSLSPNFINGFQSRITGLIPGVTLLEMGQIEIVVPSEHEQKLIADFLDEKTQEIDNIISKTKKAIKEYKKYKQSLITETLTKGLDANVEMKDSGIEWMGDIPKNWDVIKLKTFTTAISKGTTPSDMNNLKTEEYCIRYLKAENINNGISKIPTNYITIETNESLRRSKLEYNDILFIIAGATIGRVAVVKNEILPANTNQAISFIRLNNKFKPEVNIFYYILISDMIKEVIKLFSVTSAQPNLSMTNLGNVEVPFSPIISERKQIANFLDKKTNQIDNIISTKEKLLKEMEAYKKSLIYETVTGKREVE